MEAESFAAFDEELERTFRSIPAGGPAGADRTGAGAASGVTGKLTATMPTAASLLPRDAAPEATTLNQQQQQQQQQGAGPQAHLRALVHESLAAYLYGNAAFIAERLAAAAPCEENRLLLATCYFRAGKVARAYHTLKGASSADGRYLTAMCCKEMGRLSEAEMALMPSAHATFAHQRGGHGARGGSGGSGAADGADAVPNGAAGYFLLAQICRQTDRRKEAIAHLQRALSLDPFMWCAYEELCDLGADEEAQAVYGASDAMSAAALRALQAPGHETAALGDGVAAMAITPQPALGFGAGTTPVPASVMPTTVGRARGSTGHTPFNNTPIGMAQLPEATPAPVAMTPTAADFITPVGNEATPMTGAGGMGIADAPPALARGPGGAVSRPTPMSDAQLDPSSTGHKVMDDGKLRKVANGRLFNSAGMDSGTPAPRRSSRLAMKLGSDSVTRDLQGGQRGGGGAGLEPDDADIQLDDFGRKAAEAGGAEQRWVVPSASAGIAPGVRSTAGGKLVLALLHTLGEGVRHLCMYRCQEAIDAFLMLPSAQYATGWVQCKLGRAYFEMVEYAEAERAFEWARRVCPHRLEGMEVYSTVLWHVKKEAELSHLAKEAIAHDRLSPEAWCCMGNCFSLQREHETALKFFQRALQLRPSFTYAHTLCGHEYFTNEDYDKGLTCYRGAIRLDPRHYNAWYGLGAIYLRQEKFDLAEHHFRRALAINPRSSVLHCYLGMAVHRGGRHEEALQLLQTAISLDAKNPLAKFQKANVLMACERYGDALQELEALKSQAPREASVYFLMGKIYRKLDNRDAAMVNFNVALDLKPSSSDANEIKSAIEKLNVPHAEEDEEDLV